MVTAKSLTAIGTVPKAFGTNLKICFPARSDDPRSTDVIGRESGGVLTIKHLSSPFVNILKQLQTNKITMKNFTFLLKTILCFTLLLTMSITTTIAQDSPETKEVTKENMKVLGDPGEGMFFVAYHLEKDAKKVIWTVTDEKGEVLIKEKFKKIKAGKNRFQYNYVHGPDGTHTFKLVADDVVIDEIEVIKKKK